MGEKSADSERHAKYDGPSHAGKRRAARRAAHLRTPEAKTGRDAGVGEHAKEALRSQGKDRQGPKRPDWVPGSLSEPPLPDHTGHGGEPIS